MPPLKLGVLTLYVGNRTFEEQAFFRHLTNAGRKLGVLVYIFTPDDVNEQDRRIFAHYYHDGQWRRKWIAYPDLFLDRSRFHSIAKSRTISGFRKRNPDLTFISSPLANKWTLYQQLVKKPAIRTFLPSTTIYRTFSDLKNELTERKLIFLKPVNGSGGRDILRIEKKQNGEYSVRGRMPSRKLIPERKMNLVRLRNMIVAKRPVGRYIIQQGIDLRLKNGSVHDYRLLIQKNGEGEWGVTGCVGRVGPTGSVTSNLHGGGRAIPMHKLLTAWFHDDNKARSVANNMNDFAFLVAETLETTYGRLCELALDIAVDNKGHIWLLEVNSKPAREVFARIRDRETYQKAIRQPLEYAKWLHRKMSGTAS